MAHLNLNPDDFNNLDDILPAGEYQMQIVDSALRDTKAGNGQYLWLEFLVLGPNYAGSKFWERLNLFNPNETTVKVARKQLSNICAALKFDNLPNDSVQLHNKPLRVVITHKENKLGGLDARAAYHPLNDSANAAVAAPRAAAPSSAPAKPWEKHRK